jgi:hypothetical protein
MGDCIESEAIVFPPLVVSLARVEKKRQCGLGCCALTGLGRQGVSPAAARRKPVVAQKLND